MNHTTTMSGIRETISCLFRIDMNDVPDDAAIFDGGIGLDSMAAVALLEGLEKRFDIFLDSEDLTMENFRTLSALAELISRKTGAMA